MPRACPDALSLGRYLLAISLVAAWSNPSAAQNLTPVPGGGGPGGRSTPAAPRIEILSGNAPAMSVGEYLVSVPRGSSARQDTSGSLTLRDATNEITAQLIGMPGGDDNGAPVQAMDHIGALMQRWNTQFPLQPFLEAFSGDSALRALIGPGGSAVAQRYDQQYQDQQQVWHRIHGIFLLIVDARAQAIALDGFSDGPAEEAQDWGQIGSYLDVVLGGIRTSGPGDDGSEYAEDVQLALQSLERFWKRTFAGMSPRRSFRSLDGFYAYDPRLETRSDIPCRMRRKNAQYCPRINAILWDEPQLMRAWHDTDSIGDFAPAYIIAHEWAHAVQHQLGLTRDSVPNVMVELQADCFAGAWTAYAETETDRHRVDDGDLNEAAKTLFEVRDRDGVDWLDPSKHGNALQRIGAFNQGYDHGYGGCFGSMPGASGRGTAPPPKDGSGD